MSPCKPPLLWKVVSYNCQGKGWGSRISDLNRQIPSTVMGLQCTTGLRCWEGITPLHFERVRQGHLFTLQWPWREQHYFCNKSCGVSLVFDKRRVAEEHIRQVWSPPDEFQGRAGVDVFADEESETLPSSFFICLHILDQDLNERLQFDC